MFQLIHIYFFNSVHIFKSNEIHAIPVEQIYEKGNDGDIQTEKL